MNKHHFGRLDGTALWKTSVQSMRKRSVAGIMAWVIFPPPHNTTSQHPDNLYSTANTWKLVILVNSYSETSNELWTLSVKWSNDLEVGQSWGDLQRLVKIMVSSAAPYFNSSYQSYNLGITRLIPFPNVNSPQRNSRFSGQRMTYRHVLYSKHGSVSPVIIRVHSYLTSRFASIPIHIFRGPEFHSQHHPTTASSAGPRSLENFHPSLSFKCKLFWRMVANAEMFFLYETN